MWLFGGPDISKLNSTKDIGGLIAAMGYQRDSEVRRGAARVLGELGDAKAVEPLIRALRDADHRVRGCAAGALVAMVSRAPSMSIPDLPGIRSLIARPHSDSHADYRSEFRPSSSDCGNHEDRHSDDGIGLDLAGTSLGADF